VEEVVLCQSGIGFRYFLVMTRFCTKRFVFRAALVMFDCISACMSCSAFEVLTCGGMLSGQGTLVDGESVMRWDESGV
jgi:hypothetical protein